MRKEISKLFGNAYSFIKDRDWFCSIKELICIFLLAVMVTCLFKDGVNQLVMKLIPESKDTVTTENKKHSAGKGTRIQMLFDGKDGDLFETCREAARKKDWVYVEGVYGESWTSLTSDSVGSTFEISAKRTPNAYIQFSIVKAGGAVSVETSKEKQLIDTSSAGNEQGAGVIRVYPFRDSHLKLCLQFFIYFILFATVLILLLSANLYLKNNKIHIPQFLKREVRIGDIFGVWLLLYLIAAINYKVIGIPNYLQIGDEYVYWNSSLLHNGEINLKYLTNAFSFRGYWCYIFPTIAKGAGSLLHVDSVLVYLIFPSFFISMLSVYILPGLKKILCDKSAKILETICFLAVFLYSWTYCLTSVLMDLFGLVTLFACILFLLSYYKKERFIYAGVSGIMGAISCSFRLANIYVIYGSVVVLIAYKFIKKFRKWNGKLGFDKHFGTGMIIGVVSFLLIMAPQFIINSERGHLGFLPYDGDVALDGRSLIATSADVALTTGSVANPMYVSDDQMLTMKPRLYDTNTPLTMTQLFDVFAESPLESLMFITKKILIGFDRKTNVQYPYMTPDWRKSSGMIYSFVNYFILLSGLYILIFTKKVNKNEKKVAALLFLTNVLPQTFTHMEWRYIIAAYTMIYYIFAFHYIGDVVLETKEYKALVEKDNYLPFMIIMVFFMFCASFSLCARI